MTARKPKAPARKRTPEWKSRSGPNIPEAQRSTVKVQLRVGAVTAETIAERAEELGVTRSEYVSQLVYDDARRPVDE